MLLYAASGGLSCESLYICQESVLLSELRTSDVKYIAIELVETASGIEYYFQNCVRRDKEITLYCALDIADWVEDDALWIKVYEYGISKKIKPRDSLVQKYMQLTNNK